MTKTLRWGLLSTARINRVLIPILQSSRRSRLEAVGSRSVPSAEAYARQWKIPRAHGSYEALLDDPQVDVVYISLPNGTHAEWTVKALGAGKHVLCEKPLAVSLEEVAAMTAAAHGSGKILAEALMYRHHPQTRKVKELVEGRALGALQMIKGAFSFRLGRPGDIRLDADLGGGSIWDIGSYPISYARMVAGIEPVEAFGWQVQGETGIDVSFAGQLRFPGEVLFQFDCSFGTADRRYMEVAGSEASLWIANPFKPETNERLEIRRGETVEKVIIKGEGLYVGEVRDMEEAVLDGEEPRISLADSRGTVAAVVALLESARTGRPVRI